MSKNGWTLLRYIEKCRAIMKDRCCAHWHMCIIILAGLVQCSACNQSHTTRLHASAARPLSHRTSVKKQWIVSHEECTVFHTKISASVRFCRTCRSGPTTKFLNVCEVARNVRHVKHYCPFTQSSFCNSWQTLRTFRKECFFFSLCENGVIGKYGGSI